MKKNDTRKKVRNESSSCTSHVICVTMMESEVERDMAASICLTSWGVHR